MKTFAILLTVGNLIGIALNVYIGNTPGIFFGIGGLVATASSFRWDKNEG